jgi:alpha-beta hydrolase superfamily lysophospholipase
MSLEIITKKATNSRNQSLLFIHGMYHAAWCYEEYFLPYFANLGYDCYALSLQNHGKSERKKATWRLRIKDYVNDVKKAVDSIDGDPILIGHSMGGFIIQKYLEKYKAPAVVLLASVPPKGIIGSTLAVIKKYPFSLLKANLTLNLYHIIASKKASKYLFLSPDLSDKKLNEYHAKLDNEAFLAYLDMIVFDLPKPKKINQEKMLIIGAENDKVNSLNDVKNIAKVYHKKYVIIPNASHDIMLDPNWKIAAKEISSWLDKEVFYLC